MTSKNKTVKTSSAKSAEPITMEALLAQYGQKAHSFSVGDRITGKVAKKEPGKLFIDIGGKGEGLVAEKAYKEAEGFISTLSVGDEIRGRVLVTETPDGYTILSLREAIQNSAWHKIEEAYEKGQPIKVNGKVSTPAGITVSLAGITGFVPTSQLGKTAVKNPQSLVGRDFDAVVIDLDREVKKVVLSEKEVSEKEELVKMRDAIKNIQIGDEFDGEVLNIFDFGCFVRIQAPASSGKKGTIPLEGLVHVSELSWEKVDNPSDVVSEGEKVNVKVIGKKNDKLAFSMKQTRKDPWTDISSKYEKDQKIKGQITKVTDFGIFVQLESGVEGLIHITKIPPGKKYEPGDPVDVYIEDIDKDAKRISLGIILKEKPLGYK